MIKGLGVVSWICLCWMDLLFLGFSFVSGLLDSGKAKISYKVVDQNIVPRKGISTVFPRSHLTYRVLSTSLTGNTPARPGAPRSSLCSGKTEVCFWSCRSGYRTQRSGVQSGLPRSCLFYLPALLYSYWLQSLLNCISPAQPLPKQLQHHLLPDLFLQHVHPLKVPIRQSLFSLPHLFPLFPLLIPNFLSCLLSSHLLLFSLICLPIPSPHSDVAFHSFTLLLSPS